METTVVNFPYVSSLIIVEGSGHSSQTRPGPLVNACASNLRTLSLIATSANFNAHFSPNASVFTSLKEVTLSFSRGDSTANGEAASTFFQAIASTLTTLDISFSRHLRRTLATVAEFF